MAERESIDLWSTTALTNGDIDPAINFLEGQLPSTVNNSVRALMAGVARHVKDNNGSLTTAGSANAYTLTVNATWTAYATGQQIVFKASFTNTGAATLNVTNADAVAIGAKAIRGPGDSALTAGAILLGGHYLIQYDAAANGAAGAWMLLNSGRAYLATDFATPDDSSAPVVTANAAAFVAAFAVSPYIDLGGRTFHVESINVPITAKRLFNGTLVAAGTYGSNTAVVNVSNNTAGFTLDNVTISVDVSTYTTTNGVSCIGTDGANIERCSLSGIYPVYVSQATNTRIVGNTFASGTYGRAIFGLCDTAGASTFTVTSASPGVFTKAAHGLAINDTVILYSTGALYTGLTAGRICYVKTVPTADTFTLSLTSGGAAINTSGSQSGTHYYTSNGPVGIYIADNTIYQSSSVNSQGIVLIGVSDATVTSNIIFGTGHFGISSSLGEHNSITDNNISFTKAEAIHTDSGVNAIISGNVMTFDSTSADVGISISSDNGPPAINAQVIGNSIDSPYGAGIYFVGATGGSAQGNKIRNANVGDTTLSASIILDGSNTTKCLIGPNTIEDSIGNNDYQVGEANYTSGAPSANFIAPQIGATGLLGRILSVATTDTAIHASNSPLSSDTKTGYHFGDSRFAIRDVTSSSVDLFDFTGTLVASLGNGTTDTDFRFGQTSFTFYSRGFGGIYASLGSSGWGWVNVAMGSTPSAGTSRVIVDSTTKALVNKDDAGVIHTTVVPKAAVARKVVTEITSAGVVTTDDKSNTSLALRVNRATNQTPTAGAWVKVQLATEVSDPNGWFDNATNYRFQPNVACVCMVVGSIEVNVGTGSYGGISIYKNGTEYNKYILPWSGAAADAMQLSVPALVSFNGSTDYIELFGFSSSGTPLFYGGAEITKLDIYQLY